MLPVLPGLSQSTMGLGPILQELRPGMDVALPNHTAVGYTVVTSAAVTLVAQPSCGTPSQVAFLAGYSRPAPARPLPSGVLLLPLRRPRGRGGHLRPRESVPWVVGDPPQRCACVSCARRLGWGVHPSFPRKRPQVLADQTHVPALVPGLARTPRDEG